MASGHQQVNIEMRLRDKAGTSPTNMDVATSAEMYEAKPPPPIGWKQALAAGWTPALAGTPSTSKIAFYGREVLLGMIICMAQIPESIAFSYLARVRPPVALHSAWIVGLTCAVLGGRPGMVEGATGAFAAIINTFLGEPDVPGGNGAGIELVFASVMLAGVLMLLVWAFRLDRFISLLPLPVMVGFCNGLAIVIGIAQLHPFKVPKCGSCPAGATRNTGGDCVTACGDVVDGIGRRLESIVTPCTGSGWREGAELGWMLLILFTSMIIMEFSPKLPKPTDIAKKPVWQRPLAFLVEFILEIPSSVFSLGAAIALEFGLIRPLGYRTDTIGDQQRFTSSDAYPRPFFWEDSNPLYDYDISKIATWDGCRTILAQGVLLAAVGCIEGLMTAEVVTSYVKTPHHPGLVVGAMGVANILSGFMGGIGGNSMIGLSTIACINGGRGRVAPFCSALGILICISAAYSLLNYIPMAAQVWTGEIAGNRKIADESYAQQFERTFSVPYDQIDTSSPRPKPSNAAQQREPSARRIPFSDVWGTLMRPLFGRKWSSTDIGRLSFFTMTHIALVLAPLRYFSWSNLAIAFVAYCMGGMGITYSYHRQLAHRSFRTPKWLEYTAAYVGAMFAVQGAPMEWVSDHRYHHLHTETPLDPHSSYEGFWWSHVGWMLDSEIYLARCADRKNVADLAKQPFYRHLEKHYLPHLAAHFAMIAGAGALIGGPVGAAAALCWRWAGIALLYHVTWFVNSAAHLWGKQAYRTGDQSRNNWWVGFLAFGEGWHNNHHAFEYSARHGLGQRQFDITWILISALRKVGLVSHVKLPTEAAMAKLAV